MSPSIREVRKPYAQKVLRLREWERQILPPGFLTPREVERLVKGVGSGISFEQNPVSGQVTIRSSGSVGTIPIDRQRLIVIEPKIPIARLFRMIEQVYNVNLRLFDIPVPTPTIEGLLESFAIILAAGIMRRGRAGLYTSYVREERRGEEIRGRINVTAMARHPWKVEIPCSYSRRTVDNDENRILLWTLHLLLRTLPEGSRSLPDLRRACRLLAPVVTLAPYSSHDCRNRTYNRLNNDYALLHTLCRFLLDSISPHHHGAEESGNRSIPFLVDMARLFEGYVASLLGNSERLREAGFTLSLQERRAVDRSATYTFVFDILLRDRQSGETVIVIDTKYKRDEKPANSDLFQIVTYATDQGCREGMLLYPEPTTTPLDLNVGPVHVAAGVCPVGSGEREDHERIMVDQILKQTGRE